MEDLSFRADYYGADFVEDGSFLVLSTEGSSLTPTTPPARNSPEKVEIEVISEVNENEESATPMASLAESQVLGEDVESSVESVKVKDGSLQNGGANLNSISMTNMSSASASSVSTEAHLIETGEEVNLLVAENKKLTELLADSNEKMKQCITTTERLKADHEENKKKHEASREVISQLRQDNDMLRSQMSMMTSRMEESTSLDKQDSLQRQSHAISELNERLKTVLTVNGQLNEQLLAGQKGSEELMKEVGKLQEEQEQLRQKVEVMKAEIDSGRQAIQKFKEHQVRGQEELEKARRIIISLEGSVEEKSKLLDNLRRNMEDTVTSLERCNHKLNQKEQEISLLTTKLAAISAETEVFERLKILEMQCQSYRSDYEKVREEKAKLSAERDALLIELNAANQRVKLSMDGLRGAAIPRQSEAQVDSDNFQQRNDNSANANASSPLQSPLTSLPTVAGQFVGFVRRELLGWEDQAGASASAPESGSTSDSSSGASGPTTVIHQPKQEAIPPCPICRKTFPSLERLQTHASNCGIEVDEMPHDPFVFP